MNRMSMPDALCEDAYQKQIAKTLSGQIPIAVHHPLIPPSANSIKSTVRCPPKTDPTVCRLPPCTRPPYHPLVTEGDENVNNLL